MGDRYKRDACVALIILVMQISVATGQVSISLTKDQNCSAVVLICSFENLYFVRFEEFIDGFGFSPLTTNYILRNPDFEEVDREGLYKLRITQAESYNGTRYRCRGYPENSYQLFPSDEWKLTVTSNETCSTVGTNTTVKAVQSVQDANGTTIVPLNSTMQAGSEEEFYVRDQEAPTWNTGLLALIPVPVAALAIVAPLCVIVACARRRCKTVTVVNNSCEPMEEDGVVINSVLVMAAEKKDGHVSTLAAAQLGESHENEALPDDRDVLLQQRKEPMTISTLWQATTSTHRTAESGVVAEAHVSCPEDEDMINTALQSPQVASSNDAAGAIQVAGSVVMYDNVRLQLHRTLTRSVVWQDPAAVPHAIAPIPYIRSRNDCDVDNEDVPMSCNPSYVAMGPHHQSRTEEATDGSFHQPLSADTLSDVDNEDVPMSCNPAYVAMEVYNQSRTKEATDGSFHQSLSSGTLLEDVPMQDNPAYGVFESTCRSMKTRYGLQCSDSSYVYV